MKLFKLLSIISMGTFASLIVSCENGDAEFPNYEGGSTVYFASQYPVRTIVLGEDDTFDTSLDNQHRCEIYATIGGVYANNQKVTIDIEVDNTLCDNLYFDEEKKEVVRLMPDNYYTLGGNQIVLDHDKWGAVTVQLTDAFFADENALKNTYAIPIVMKKADNADHILTGTPLIEGDTPIRTNSAYWNVQPKDYVLYCLKFINPWHASYLRRGIDVVNENGISKNIVRHNASVEKDEICYLTSDGLKTSIFSFNASKITGETTTCDLQLIFNDNNECIVTASTDKYTAMGTGKFVKDGEKKSWGNKDRNALYLDYKIDFRNGIQCATKDTLVVQSRGVVGEWFTPTYSAN